MLAYYIAAVNIEQVYHGIMGGDYVPFKGICLTDTFALYEKEDLVDTVLTDNSERRKRQKNLDIRVIMGNPPYSSSQENQNDDNKNIDYPSLDDEISRTYVANSLKKMGKSKAYDSYIRAIRWASNRLGKSGVIGFVSNASFLDSNTADGLRKCLAEEFSSIYVFHLRGNARTSGEIRRKEKDNVFGQGTRTPIAISILIKNPKASEHGKIFFHDIGDYLSKEDKFERMETLRSIQGITESNGWQRITPNEHYDWIGQRSDETSEFMSIGRKSAKSEDTVFNSYSMGLKTNRDEWVIQFSKNGLRSTLSKMVDFYNAEVDRLAHVPASVIDSKINTDKSKIKWTTDDVMVLAVDE